MDYDNNRDRFAYGYDAGIIVSGEVQLDPDTQEFVVMDEHGKAFSSQSVLKAMVGKSVRMTCISTDAMAYVEEMMKRVDIQATTKD